MQTGVIFDIKRFAIHDGPGIRTTVFLKGCPLKCAWCHNPEGRSPEPEEWRSSRGAGQMTTVGQTVTSQWLLDELAKECIFYEESGGGVTFSGGEPLMQPEFLAELIEGCRKLGFHIAVDTTGYAEPEEFSRLVEHIDLLLFDLKIMDPADHLKHTGVGNGWIMENLRGLAGSKTELLIRFPLIPGVTDSNANIAAALTVLAELGSVNTIQLLPYHTMGHPRYARLGLPEPLPGVQPPGPVEVSRVREMFAKSGYNVTLGGH